MIDLTKLTLNDYLSICSILVFISTSITVLVRWRDTAKNAPMLLTLQSLDNAIKNLEKEMKESRESRRENEVKLFAISDEHTKAIANHDGRIDALERTTNK